LCKKSIPYDINGKPTLRLRRDKEGPREDIYGDLYARHEETKAGKLIVTFNCCIEGLLLFLILNTNILILIFI
jgi:hypothetical protein